MSLYTYWQTSALHLYVSLPVCIIYAIDTLSWIGNVVMSRFLLRELTQFIVASIIIYA